MPLEADKARVHAEDHVGIGNSEFLAVGPAVQAGTEIARVDAASQGDEPCGPERARALEPLPDLFGCRDHPVRALFPPPPPVEAQGCGREPMVLAPVGVEDLDVGGAHEAAESPEVSPPNRRPESRLEGQELDPPDAGLGGLFGDAFALFLAAHEEDLLAALL